MDSTKAIEVGETVMLIMKTDLIDDVYLYTKGLIMCVALQLRVDGWCTFLHCTPGGPLGSTYHTNKEEDDLLLLPTRIQNIVNKFCIATKSYEQNLNATIYVVEKAIGKELVHAKNVEETFMKLNISSVSLKKVDKSTVFMKVTDGMEQSCTLDTFKEQHKGTKYYAFEHIIEEIEQTYSAWEEKNKKNIKEENLALMFWKSKDKDISTEVLTEIPCAANAISLMYLETT